jgi:hypothetical protein
MVHISDVNKHVAVRCAREERKAVRIQMDAISTWQHGSGLESSAQSIPSEVIKQMKSPKSYDFAQNLVSNELVASIVKLMIARNPRLMRRGQSQLSVVILYLFIPFSRGRSLMSRRSTLKISQGRHNRKSQGRHTSGNIIANAQETRSARTRRSTPKIHTDH